MDVITYEVIRNGLYAIAREMKIAMMRTAGSPLIHSGGDSSAAVFDADMQLVAQGNDIPTMLGSAGNLDQGLRRGDRQGESTPG